MAGDWIKVESVTPDKPEVFQIAETLGIDPDAVVGKLVRLWIWADQQTYEGDAGSVTLTQLDRITNAQGFGNAMLLSGWLVQDDRGLVFPRFERHNGQTAKSRALSARRMRDHRAKKPLRARYAESVTASSLTLSNRSSSSKRSSQGKNDQYSEDFETFWSIYPKVGRVKKQAAWKAWKAQLKLGKRTGQILEIVRRYAESDKGRSEYAGYAATFLNSMLDDDPDDWTRGNNGWRELPQV